MSSVPSILKNAYTSNFMNCAGFLKDVFESLRIPYTPDNADGLIRQICNTWTKIGTGLITAPTAIRWATEGYLVVAVLAASEHAPHKDGSAYKYGHVAVVLPRAGREGYPVVICGSNDPTGNGRSDGASKSVHGVWRKVDAPHVAYYRTTVKYSKLVGDK